MSDTGFNGGGASSAFMDAVNSGGETEAPQSGPPSDLRQALKQASSGGDGAQKQNRGLDFDPLKQGKDRNDEPTDRQRREPAKEEPRETRQEAAERRLKVKIDGQEREVAERDLIDSYQRRESANKRFQEASSLKKAAEERAAKAEALLRDPKALLAHLINDGDGVKSVHEAYQELTKLAGLPPDKQQEYLRMRELENRDAQLREMEEAKQAEAREAQEDAQIDQHLDGLEDAFEKIGWSPGEKQEELADMLFTSILDEVKETGMKGVTYRHIAQTIKGAIEDTAMEWLSSLDDAALSSAIGAKRLQSLMGGQVKTLQSKLPTQVDRNPNQLPRDRSGRYEVPKPIVHQPGDMKSFRAIVEGPRR